MDINMSFNRRLQVEINSVIYYTLEEFNPHSGWIFK